jgi:CHAT domain-containing protein
LLSLRWVLNSPVTALSEHAVLQRQTLLGQFPHYAELWRRSNAVQQQLQEMVPVPIEEATRVKQRDLFIELHTLSTKQERVLREIALRRAPADMVFPPPLNFEQAQARLQPGQSVLSFLITSRAVYVFRFGRDSYSAVEQLAEPGRIEEGIVAFLRSLGQLDKNQALSVETLLDTRWQPIAAALFEQLGQRGLPAGTDELIVVPDGPLWYLPFEALLMPDGDGLSSVISRHRVRYAPTVALAFPDKRRVSQVSETAVLPGRLFPRDDEEVSLAATEELNKLMPNVSNLNGAVKVPGDLFATICDRLIVFDDIDQGSGGPYGCSPLPLDRGKQDRPLSRWMSLPWGGPQQIVLPGFHTAAEVSLKRGGNGNEVFLSLCGLMSTGARTVLISRWRPGGQSTYDLVREFVQELPFTTAADAWQRSVQLVSNSELMLDKEPRVSPVELEAALTTNHPFFWASHMLVDTGAAAVSDTPAEPPR